MSLDTLQPAGDFSDIYLRQLEDLIAEMNTGMDAIAGNSVGPLWESIARQEALCAGLASAALADGHRLRDLSQSSLPLQEDPIGVAIWKTSNTIRHLNLQYDALLEQSTKTASMLSALCDNHAGRSLEIPGDRSKQQTWSCEI